MDKEAVRAIALRLPDTLKALESSTAEEATKMALIIPFINSLGYNASDPTEVVPEFAADFGDKRGDKVDYAIMQTGTPRMLIECKPAHSNLTDNNAGQLSRYFGAIPDLHLAVLTNGVEYRFFADLDKPNVMDTKPFLAVHLRNLTEDDLTELDRFSKDRLDVNQLLDDAAVLKNTREVKSILARQLIAPDSGLVKWIITELGGRQNKGTLEQFTKLTKDAFGQLVSELVHQRIRQALHAEEETADPELGTQEADEGIVTTLEELESYCIVKSILRDIAPPDAITYNDTAHRCSIFLNRRIAGKSGGRIRICTLYFNASQKKVAFRGVGDTAGETVSFPITETNDLYSYAERLVSIAQDILGDDPQPENTIPELNDRPGEVSLTPQPPRGGSAPGPAYRSLPLTPRPQLGARCGGTPGPAFLLAPTSF